MIAPISAAITTTEGLVEALNRTPAEIAFLIPSIVQGLAQDSSLLKYCSKHLEAILYCGGDLPKSIGDTVASKIRLFNQFGASELGLTAQIIPKTDWDPKDWKYAHFHPDLGLELRVLTGDVYELYVVRDPAKQRHQPTFTLFPELKEYASRDLFGRHPSKGKQDLWGWRARADDIIVFLNGEKTNPISMEQHITSQNPEVVAALVFGNQRLQAGLLVERIAGGQILATAGRAAFLEKMWPAIEEANTHAPAHARIAKSHILFTQPQKPMLRAGKGTIQRAGTLQLYAKEIDALYDDANKMSSSGQSSDAFAPSLLGEAALSRIITKAIIAVTSWPHVDEQDNLFTLGMDSLQTLLLVRELRQHLVVPNLAPSTIYTNPSVAHLVRAIFQLSAGQQVSKTSSEQSKVRARCDIIKKYQHMIDKICVPPKSTKANPAEKVFILTGSTGALGSHILHQLLADRGVSRIYCLNRTVDGLSHQKERNRASGFPLQMDLNRVSFLTAELSRPHLSLPQETFDQILRTVTHIIHNAWPVNFNLSLSSFCPQLDGLVNLIDLTTKAVHSPHFFFISSISSVMSYRSARAQIPEKVITADEAPGANGYAESKYVSEQLLHHASHRLPVKASIARVGQIAGAVNHAGVWNKAEWFPSMAISSRHIGAIPESFGAAFDRIDWVPIDLLAEILVELAFRGSEDVNLETPKLQVFHPLNPHPTKWRVLRNVVMDELSTLDRKPMKVLPLHSWTNQVRQDFQAKMGASKSLKDDEIKAQLEANPAAKLLEFYENVLGADDRPVNVLEVKETLRCSTQLSAVSMITDPWMRKWIREWFSVDEQVASRTVRRG